MILQEGDMKDVYGDIRDHYFVKVKVWGVVCGGEILSYFYFQLSRYFAFN